MQKGFLPTSAPMSNHDPRSLVELVLGGWLRNQYVPLAKRLITGMVLPRPRKRKPTVHAPDNNGSDSCTRNKRSRRSWSKVSIVFETPAGHKVPCSEPGQTLPPLPIDFPVGQFVFNTLNDHIRRHCPFRSFPGAAYFFVGGVLVSSVEDMCCRVKAVVGEANDANCAPRLTVGIVGRFKVWGRRIIPRCPHDDEPCHTGNFVWVPGSDNFLIHQRQSISDPLGRTQYFAGEPFVSHLSILPLRFGDLCDGCEYLAVLRLACSRNHLAVSPTSAAFNPNGVRTAIVDIASGKVITRLPPTMHCGPGSWGCDGRLFMVTSDRVLKFYDPVSDKRKHTLTFDDHRWKKYAKLNPRKRLVCVRTCISTKVLDFTGDTVWHLDVVAPCARTPSTCAWSPCGNFLAVGFYGTLNVVVIKNGVLFRTLFETWDGHDDTTCTEIHWHPDGDILAVSYALTEEEDEDDEDDEDDENDFAVGLGNIEPFCYIFSVDSNMFLGSRSASGGSDTVFTWSPDGKMLTPCRKHTREDNPTHFHSDPLLCLVNVPRSHQ